MLTVFHWLKLDQIVDRVWFVELIYDGFRIRFNVTFPSQDVIFGDFYVLFEIICFDVFFEGSVLFHGVSHFSLIVARCIVKIIYIMILHFDFHDNFFIQIEGSFGWLQSRLSNFGLRSYRTIFQIILSKL